MQKSLTQLLDALVNDKTFAVFPSENKKIKLEDLDSAQEHEILGLPSAAFLVKVKSNQNWAFTQSPYGKICDYLIFIPENEELKIVFCELKKTFSQSDEKSHKKDVAEQIIATIPLFHYLLSAIDTHFGKKWKISEHYALIAMSSDAETGDEERSSKPKTKEGPADFYEWSKNTHNPDEKIRIDLILDADKIFPISAITERRKSS